MLRSLTSRPCGLLIFVACQYDPRTNLGEYVSVHRYCLPKVLKFISNMTVVSARVSQGVRQLIFTITQRVNLLSPRGSAAG